MQEKAKKYLSYDTIVVKKTRYLFVSEVWPGYQNKANGVNVWDLDCNKSVDMSISSIGSNILGYVDKYVNFAVMEIIKEERIENFLKYQPSSAGFNRFT